MKLRVIVEVVDEENRKGTRRKREVEISERVINMNKALCESRKQLRAFLADDVMSKALKAVSTQQDATESFNEALVETDETGQRPSGSKHSKLDEFLGLDVIQHMDKVEP